MSWQWDFEANHSMEVTLGDGLAYKGCDWASQSGGEYMAGFQSVEEFLEAGGLKKMPEDIAQEIRAEIARNPRQHRVSIRLSGETPDQVHLELNGAPMIFASGDLIFSGSLPGGVHKIEGIALYPGEDEKGRRKARKFSLTFSVPGEPEILITKSTPRWADS